MKVKYFALFKEHIQKDEETFDESFSTPLEVLNHIQSKYQLPLNQNQIRVAINEEFAHWDSALNQGDVLVFIPPVAGG